MLTTELLKSIYNYDKNTGHFTRLKKGKYPIGSIVGSKDRGYIFLTIKGKRYSAHRLAWLYMTGAFPTEQIDHINGVKDDNSFLNLREATHIENHKNLPRHKRNKSGVSGVTKERNKWKSAIGVDGKTIVLGYYSDFDEAVRVRKDAEAKYGYHINHGRSA